MKRPNLPAKVVYVATFFAMAAFVGGYAMAGALTISQGPAESAGGNFESTNSIAWWSQASVGLTSVASPLPTQLATTSSSPTVLAATGQAYLINTGAAGDVAHFFKMTESTSAPVSTEIEVVFTVSTGLSPVITTVTVFLESQSTAPGTAQTFVLEYDLGSPTSASIVLNSVEQISQQCTAVGTCP
jgi:hypothetical protein